MSRTRVWPVKTLFYWQHLSEGFDGKWSTIMYIYSWCFVFKFYGTQNTHPHTYACCHARFHDLWLPFCFKVFIYAKLHKLLCDVTGWHYNTRNSDSLTRTPCGLGGGDGWHFRLDIYVPQIKKLHVKGGKCLISFSFLSFVLPSKSFRDGFHPI